MRKGGVEGGEKERVEWRGGEGRGGTSTSEGEGEREGNNEKERREGKNV